MFYCFRDYDSSYPHIHVFMLMLMSECKPSLSPEKCLEAVFWRVKELVWHNVRDLVSNRPLKFIVLVLWFLNGFWSLPVAPLIINATYITSTG